MFNRLIRFLAGQGDKQFGVVARAVVAILGAAVFVVLFPVLVTVSGTLGVLKTRLLPEIISVVLMGLCFGFGTPWMVWSVFWQLTQSGGTPVPTMPPRQFLPTGPYRYTRNPMMLGFWGYLLGWVFLSNRLGALLAALAIIGFFWAELKLIEEKELELRFGDAYRAYKKQTPFLFPRLKK